MNLEISVEKRSYIYPVVFNEDNLYLGSRIHESFKRLHFDGILSETDCSHRRQPCYCLSSVTDSQHS